MGEFLGIYLREARESKNLTLEDVANETKIQKRYLEAIESEDFESLPGDTYAKGFLKTYAVTVGLEPVEVIQKYQDFIEEREKEEQIDETEIDNNDRKTIKSVLIAVLVLIVFYLAVTLIGTFTQTEKNVNETNIQETTQENSIQKELKTENGIEINSSKIKNIKVIGKGRSWLEIQVGEEKLFTGYIEDGEKKEVVSSDKIFVRVGDASLVEIEKDGKNLGRLGEAEEVVRKEF